MIANDDQDDVAIRLGLHKAGEHLVIVRQRARIARSKVQPIRRLVKGALPIVRIVRMVGQHAAPVRLVRRRGIERRVRADRRKEGEHRRARLTGKLQLIEPGKRELIRDAPPPELWPMVGESLGAVDVIEAIERAFRPPLPESRHERDRPIAATRKRRHQRLAFFGHQKRIRVGFANFNPRDQADVGKP